MPPFLGQSRIAFPDNANVAPQLTQLGATVAQGIKERRNARNMQFIGQKLQSGDLQGAMQAAGQVGRMDVALQIANAAEAQKRTALQQQGLDAQISAQNSAAAHRDRMYGLVANKDAREQALFDSQQRAAQSFRQSMGMDAGQAVPAQAVPAQAVPGAGGSLPAGTPVAFPDAGGDTAVLAGQPQAPQVTQTEGPQMPANIRAEIAAIASSGKPADLARASAAMREWKEGALADTNRISMARDQTQLLAGDIKELLAPDKINALASSWAVYHKALEKGAPLTSAVAMPQEVRDALATLESLSAKLGFGKLQEIRNASKTGGGVGALAVQELNLMVQSFKAIKPGMSKELLVKNLNEIGRRAAKIDGYMHKIYTQKYGSAGMEAPQPWKDIDPDSLPEAKTKQSNNLPWGYVSGG